MRALIALLPGDGIGPEVTAEAVRALEAVARRFGHELVFEAGLVGGAAIEAAGEPLPERTLRLCRSADAVLLGAVGGPRWDSLAPQRRPERGLLALRRELGLFANLRPVRTHPRLAAASPLRPERLAGVDLVIVRELTGGLYFGEKRRDAAGASDLCAYSREEITRVVQVAARLAAGRRGKLTSVDKANVLETSRLWREVAGEIVATEHPGIELEHQLVDSCAYLLLSRPASYDVLVTENLFGDILSDEAAALAGSLGMLPSASLGTDSANGGGRGLYEPVHGSAPDLAGQGIANPYGAVLSAALLLRHSLGLEEEAAAIESAVEAALSAGIVTADLATNGRTATTREVGAAIEAAIRNCP